MHPNKDWPRVTPKPDLPSDTQLADTSSIVASLFTIEPVSIKIAFDNADEPLVELKNPRSSSLFELLSKANLRRGTVLELKIRDAFIGPASIARLNAFLHVPSHSEGFHGWKLARCKLEGSVSLWKCAQAWTEFKSLLKL